jgi:hypothetical protein
MAAAVEAVLPARGISTIRRSVVLSMWGGAGRVWSPAVLLRTRSASGPAWISLNDA